MFAPFMGVCHVCGHDHEKDLVEFNKPVQEPIAYGVYDEVENTWEYISEYRSMANDHISGMEPSEIKNMRLYPLYLMPK